MQNPINAIDHKRFHPEAGNRGLSHKVEYMEGINVQIIFWPSINKNED